MSNTKPQFNELSGFNLSSMGVEELTSLVQWQLKSAHQKPWLAEETHNGQMVQDVLIIGGAQLGVALSTRLRVQHGLENVQVIDQRVEGQQGTWNDETTRNKTLRTPKHQPQPVAGLESLSPENYFKALYGEQKYNETTFIPVSDFAGYLDWYRDVTSTHVEFETKALEISESEPGIMQVILETPQGQEIAYARHVVNATGFNSNNAPIVPNIIETQLDRSSYAHTSEAIDFSRAREKTFLVLGNGASAFDAAAVALEHGGQVDLFYRKDHIPQDNPYRRMEHYAYLNHMIAMKDQDKYEMAEYIMGVGQAPPLQTVERCLMHGDRFRIHPSCSIIDAKQNEGSIVIETSGENLEGDFLILGTGYNINPKVRPEMSKFADNIATWGDMYPPARENKLIHEFPYLDHSSAYIPRDLDSAKGLERIHDATFSSFMNGLGGASLSAMAAYSHNLATEIARQLAQENIQNTKRHIMTAGPDQLELLKKFER